MPIAHADCYGSNTESRKSRARKTKTKTKIRFFSVLLFTSRQSYTVRFRETFLSVQNINYNRYRLLSANQSPTRHSLSRESIYLACRTGPSENRPLDRLVCFVPELGNKKNRKTSSQNGTNRSHRQRRRWVIWSKYFDRGRQRFLYVCMHMPQNFRQNLKPTSWLRQTGLVVSFMSAQSRAVIMSPHRLGWMVAVYNFIGYYYTRGIEQ